MALRDAFKFLSADDVTMPHKYAMGQELRYASPQIGPDVTLRVIGQIVRRNHAGAVISYRCRQIRAGEVLRDTLEVDECEIIAADGAAKL